MIPHIIKYPVQHPILKKHIKFFWTIRAEQIQLNHKIIPVRNIDLKFNLSETPQYLCMNKKQHLLEDVYFSGLHDQFKNARIKLTGNVNMLGICFLPEGLYPFLGIPISEFRNKWLGAGEISFKPADRICERLKSANNTAARLLILEEELVALLNNKYFIPENFRKIFTELKQNNNSFQLSEFCKRNNISPRTLERLFNKYVGLSAKTYSTLNRFQNSMNQVLYNKYSKLSEVAYDNGYFDQMHFIKEFKRYAGNTPKEFVNQNNSMLHIGKFK